jgi:hypothetical protein
MTTPGSVVQRQLDAYNAKDVAALVATYADAAALFEHPDKLLARGAAASRAPGACRARRRSSPGRARTPLRA